MRNVSAMIRQSDSSQIDEMGRLELEKKIIKKKTKKTRKPDSDTEIREIDRSDDIGLVAEMELKPAGKSGDLLTG